MKWIWLDQARRVSRMAFQNLTATLGVRGWLGLQPKRSRCLPVGRRNSNLHSLTAASVVCVLCLYFLNSHKRGHVCHSVNASWGCVSFCSSKACTPHEWSHRCSSRSECTSFYLASMLLSSAQRCFLPVPPTPRVSHCLKERVPPPVSPTLTHTLNPLYLAISAPVYQIHVL